MDNLHKGPPEVYCVQGGLREWLCKQQGQPFWVVKLDLERLRLVVKAETKELDGFLEESIAFEKAISEKNKAVLKLIQDDADRNKNERDTPPQLLAVRRETAKINAMAEGEEKN
ncbi:hypothetical protein ACMFMF_009801 [Clarireedia jacksonii]